MIKKSRFFNSFSSKLVMPAITAFTIAAFSVFPAFSGDAADYMFVLKDGSNIMGSVESESALDDAAVTAIKVKTAFGEVSIPREQIAKYFKQPSKKAEAPKAQEEVKKAEVKAEPDTTLKTKAESNDKKNEEANVKPAAETKPENTKSENKQEVSEETKKTEATKETKSQPLPEKEATKNEVKPPVDEMTIPENTPEAVTKGDDPALKSPAKPSKNADTVLNMDDDKLIDMLGESKVEAPKTPALETSTEGTSEIESIKAKYQYKKNAPKELVPKNLNSLTDDVKLIAASRTEEAILLGGTKEVKVKLADTAPVEVITVGDKKGKGEDGDAKKNKKKKKGAKDKKSKEGTGEVSLGTGEVGLTTAEIMITDETEEVKKLGGGNLSEDIVKQFKKHKAYPADSVEGKKHLEDEINKHFKKDEPKPADETAEVEAGKADKKDKKK